MAITDQDIRLMQSEILSDDDDGGGQMTGNEVVDGVSNNLFPDVSELDRTIGRVSLRKVFPGALSTNTDMYYGSNVIINEAPVDPNVSVTLFSTKSWDDQRKDAVSRMESYLARGPKYQGYLYDHHIDGQKALVLVQRTDKPLPAVGSTLVIVQDPDGIEEKQQFVRITDVNAIESTFSAAGCGEFVRNLVTCEISDPLQFDVDGCIPDCIDTVAEASGNSKVYNTVVADAATYAGMVTLDEPATTGDYTIKTESIYTQLVPSAQIETAITDATPNNDSALYIASGAEITWTLSTGGNQASVYLGGGVLPNSISATVDGGAEITDEAGVLYQSGVQIGIVDYANGILTSDSVKGAGVLTITCIPAATPTRNIQSAAWDVTPATRSGTVVFMLDPVPAPGSLSVAFMAQGKWYVLRDDGTGALRGSDSSYGSGTVSLVTGTVVVTMGALPDVGSSVIVNWGTDLIDIDRSGEIVKAQQILSVTTPLDGGSNPTSLARNGISLSWDAGAKVAIDDGAGNLTGDATGRVNYVDKEIEFIPNVLPDGGDTITVENGYGPMSSDFTASGDTITLDTPPVPGTVKIILPITSPGVGTITLVDDSAGNLLPVEMSYGSTNNQSIIGSVMGTVNYSTGECEFSSFLAATWTYTYEDTCESYSTMGDRATR